MKAAVRCRVEVQERLKAPTSTSFHSEDVRYEDAKGVSIVIGAVHAQSSFGASFGANIRKRYFRALSQEGDNRVTNEIVFEQR
jgi:hypothetical protein